MQIFIVITSFSNVKNPHQITPYPDPQDISQNFTEEIKKSNYTVAKLYLPWCAYQQINIPVWNKLAAEYKNKQHEVRFVNVNCDNMEEKNYCKEKLDFRGSPTFRIYKNGKVLSEFRPTWPRNYDIFEAWLNRDLNDTKKRNQVN